MDGLTLRALARRNRRDKAREALSRGTLNDAIWRAADEGWSRAGIAREVDLSRERVRQICDPAYRAKRKANRR